MTIYTANISVGLSDVEILEIVEIASYGIAYWASDLKIDREGKKLELVEIDGERNHSLSFRDVFDAVHRLMIEPELSALWIHDQIRPMLLDCDTATLDRDGADVIIQVACFGEIIYG